MPFEERFNQIVKKSTPTSPLRMWINTLILSISVFVFGSAYLFARRGNFDLYIANKVFATTALVLIGLSFALSGLCYFWDFVDTKIIYRKILGLTGFYYSLVHIFVTLFLLPNKFPLPSWILGHVTTVFFATLGLIIFTAMAIASKDDVMHELGSKKWRMTMRAGYIAYIFIIIHFTMLKYKGWINWFNTKEPFLPPLSLLEIFFAVAVIGIRIALEISLRKKKLAINSEASEVKVDEPIQK
jgi:DMSO/TMAO reductase YedYZ heme-binding membrane subunit